MDDHSIYLDPQHYDLIAQMTAPPDLPFYLEQIKRYGDPVLELACGTGRLCLPLADAGHQITGLDSSIPMIAHARHKAQLTNTTIELIQADIRDFNLNQTFATIIIPYNSINLLLDLDSLTQGLAAAVRHLAPAGRLIIDTFNPSLPFLAQDNSRPLHILQYLDPDSQARVIMTETSLYDPATQINHITWHYEIDGRPDAMIHRAQMRVIFPQELDAILTLSGLRIEHKYGHYDLDPFSSASPQQLIVARDRRGADRSWAHD